MKFLLIAGHGAGDSGACANGYKEAELTREVVSLVKSKLERYAEVDIADTSKNWYQHICKKGNSFNFKAYDYVLEIHFNANKKETVSNGQTVGTEIYVTTSENAVSVEEGIVGNISSLGFKNRGVKRKNYDLISYIKKQGVSAALLEVCFIDDIDDMKIFTSKKGEVIDAIVNGIVAGFNLKEIANKGGTNVSDAITVMKLPTEVYVQEINPIDFEISVVDKKKKDIPLSSYFNCGYFTSEKGGKTIPVGNLANNGRVISQAKDNASWINVSKKKLTTIYTKTDSTCGITKTADLSEIQNLKAAVSGIPIIVGGRYVPIEDIKAEGYFGDELYDTWHSFLGIRHNKLVYVAMECDYGQMCWALVALGIYDAIKLDGGGSFILMNGERQKYTSENRRIHNIGLWM